jgi:adenine-specific DNA methylase
MVVPSELLHVIHAKPLRDFLLANCSTVLVLDPQDIWFNDTLQGIVLLFAEKAESTTVARIAVKTVRNRSELNECAQRHFVSANYISGSVMNGKWMLSLLSRSEQTLLLELASHPAIKQFKDVASVDVGIVTGANKFFLVPDSVVEEYGLQKWAHPMFGRSDHVQGVIYDNANHQANVARELPTNFIWFPKVPLSDLSDGARRYVRHGEALGLHSRFKCRVRSPWYSVPSVHTSPVGMLKRSHNFPRLVLNRLDAFTTDTAYRIESDTLSPAALVSGFVNSLTALTAELEGRHYGGGVLELVPSEIEKLLVPVAQLDRKVLTELDRAVKRRRNASDTLAAQDELVLMPLGITNTRCKILRDAWERLRDRRHRTPTARQAVDANS